MGLLSFFKRRTDAGSASTGAGDSADGVQQARIRARQRLIGAVVLVVVGVVGFPLVFETQPRPIPVDVPIEIPRKDGSPAPVLPAARQAATPAATAPAPRDDMITESRSEAGREIPAPAATPAATPAPAPAPAAAAEHAAPKPAPKQPVETAHKSAPPADAARAKALLEGEPAAKGDATRFIVQVGAFAEVTAARETRLKVEKLGLKTYTQVAETAAGKRIRVRVGPFASREEADKVVAKAGAAGIKAVVLTL
jgi:DedD protein